MTEYSSKTSGFLGWLFLVFVACLLLGGFAGGIALSIWGASQVIDGRSSPNWPACEGNVVAVKLFDNRGDLSAEIEYAYVVDNRRFKGNRLTCATTRTDPDSARKAYPEGKTVVVRYHPKHPDRSVLKPGVCPDSYFILGSGIVFILGTTTMTVVSARAISKHNKRVTGQEKHRPKAPSGATGQATPGSQPRIWRIKTKADLEEFFLEAAKDDTLASLLVDVIEHLGRDGYFTVERGGNGSPYEVEYQEPREGTQKAFGIQAECSSLRQALALAHSNSERDRIERRIAELVGAFGTIRINVVSSDEFNRQKALISEAWAKFKQVTSNTE